MQEIRQPDLANFAANGPCQARQRQKSKADQALHNFQVAAAADDDTRASAYRLAYSVYTKKGYVTPLRDGVLVAPYDVRPDTLTVLACDMAGVAAGTVTLVFDSSDGLPSDEIFRDELNALRREGRYLTEITRLAIGEEHANDKALLALLCNITFAYSSRIRGFTDLMIEVNPRHVAFYCRLLKFNQVGAERACPRVNGAPAVLLRADLATYIEDMERLTAKTFPVGERSLFPDFLSERMERLLCTRLARQHRPMTVAQIARFALRFEVLTATSRSH
jgi:hypothetical protein